jgi:hypothetical protein
MLKTHAKVNDQEKTAEQLNNKKHVKVNSQKKC